MSLIRKRVYCSEKQNHANSVVCMVFYSFSIDICSFFRYNSKDMCSTEESAVDSDVNSKQLGL